MKSWQKIGLGTLAVLVLFGIRIYFIHRERSQPMVVKNPVVMRSLSADEIVQPRKLYIDDLKSAKVLVGKPVWIKTGYMLDYYPYAGHRVDYKKKVGVLPGAQKLEIKDFVEQAAPANQASRVPLGSKQVLAVFTMPGDEKEYAAPVGYLQGTDSTYYCDELFYYDDPHVLYKHWPADVWQAIDQHEAKVGMNELQVTMALGQVQQSDSATPGDRMVRYDAGGKAWDVTFVKDKATEVKAE